MNIQRTIPTRPYDFVRHFPAPLTIPVHEGRGNTTPKIPVDDPFYLLRWHSEQAYTLGEINLDITRLQEALAKRLNPDKGQIKVRNNADWETLAPLLQRRHQSLLQQRQDIINAYAVLFGDQAARDFDHFTQDSGTLGNGRLSDLLRTQYLVPVCVAGIKGMVAFEGEHGPSYYGKWASHTGYYSEFALEHRPLPLLYGELRKEAQLKAQTFYEGSCHYAFAVGEEHKTDGWKLLTDQFDQRLKIRLPDWHAWQVATVLHEIGMEYIDPINQRWAFPANALTYAQAEIALAPILKPATRYAPESALAVALRESAGNIGLGRQVTGLFRGQSTPVRLKKRRSTLKKPLRIAAQHVVTSPLPNQLGLFEG